MRAVAASHQTSRRGRRRRRLRVVDQQHEHRRATAESRPTLKFTSGYGGVNAGKHRSIRRMTSTGLLVRERTQRRRRGPSRPVATSAQPSLRPRAAVSRTASSSAPMARITKGRGTTPALLPSNGTERLRFRRSEASLRSPTLISALASERTWITDPCRFSTCRTGSSSCRPRRRRPDRTRPRACRSRAWACGTR